jgi:hypothetical protein
VGHLGYFHSLAIGNNATINMSVQVPSLLLDLHSFGDNLKVEMLDHMPVLFLGL